MSRTCAWVTGIQAARTLRDQILRDVEVAIVDHPQLALAEGQQPCGPNGARGGLVDGGRRRACDGAHGLVELEGVLEAVEAAGLNQCVGFREPRRHIDRLGGLDRHGRPGGRATAEGQREPEDNG